MTKPNRVINIPHYPSVFPVTSGAKNTVLSLLESPGTERRVGAENQRMMIDCKGLQRPEEVVESLEPVLKTTVSSHQAAQN